MQRNLNPEQKCLLTVSGALAAILVLAFVGTFHLNVSSDVRKWETNNPDKFHLIDTNSAYDYSFTYDPLAADQWRFETGGFIVTNHP
jgi:hypothetical protein